MVRTEAGELSDGELNMVVGGANLEKGAAIREVIGDVDHIQSLLAEFGAPQSTGSGIKLPGTHAETPEEKTLVKELGALIGNFEKSHDLESKAGQFRKSDERLGQDLRTEERAQEDEFTKQKAKNPGESEESIRTRIAQEHAGKYAALESEYNERDDKTAKTVGKSGGVVTDEEAGKLKQIGATLERLATFDQPPRTRQQELKDYIRELEVEAKSAGKPAPTAEIKELRDAEEKRSKDIESKLKSSIEALETSAKGSGKPYPRGEIEELKKAARVERDGYDTEATRKSLIQDLTKLKAEFQDIQRKEAGSATFSKPGFPSYDLNLKNKQIV